MPVPAGNTSATIVFVERSTTLSQPAADEVKAFAAKRGKGTISVIGYGDSTSSDPEAQSAALNLGLSRAQSIVDGAEVGRRARHRHPRQRRSFRSRRVAAVATIAFPNPERPVMSSDSSGEFHRIRRLPPYVFAEVNTAKAKARGAGEDIIDLGMGNPDSPTPPHIVAKLVETVQDPRSHRYSVSKGIPGLRRALAAYYERRFNVQPGPGDRGRRHPGVQGRSGQPGLGDHQPGRHDPGAEPVLSDPPVRLHHRRRRGAQRPGRPG